MTKIVTSTGGFAAAAISGVIANLVIKGWGS
jgi:hypothetical protein